MIQRPGRPVGEAEGRAYEITLDATLAAGERRHIVTVPTVAAFRATRLVLPRDLDVDTIVVHNMITNGKTENRHATFPCSLGNLIARLVPGHVILSRCEIGSEIGFEIENKAGHAQRFRASLLGEGFKDGLVSP